MELREYMSVRRAYNLVRQSTDSSERLTFEEFAILCRLDLTDVAIKTSDIAEYQGALRPTMTHRTNHLAALGLIDRGEGKIDRRNIVCTISEDGRTYVRRLAERTRSQIPTGRPLARTSSDRVRRYVDAMGAVYCTAGDLVLLALSLESEGRSTVTRLVERLGLLQPTVSMSVSSLAERGLVVRDASSQVPTRSNAIVLTEKGATAVDALVERINEVVVRRKPRM